MSYLWTLEFFIIFLVYKLEHLIHAIPCTFLTKKHSKYMGAVFL